MDKGISPKIDFKLNLPTMLKIADIIEENHKITYKEIENKTGLPRPKIENHKKWLVLLGLFNLENKPTVLGKHRVELRYEKKEFFSEICHYNLIKNSIIYEIVFLEGLTHYRKNNNQKFKIEDLKKNLLSNCPKWNFTETNSEKSIDLYLKSIATNEGLAINIIREVKKNEIEYISYKPQEETIFYILNLISIKRKEENRGGMIIDRDIIYVHYDSLINIFSSTRKTMDEILGKLQNKGYLTIETAAELNQIALHTEPRNEEEILKKILEGI